jgi:molecular chaperone DnaK (HSP70)
MTWGYGVDDIDTVEWFKLLLLDEAEMDEEQRKSPQLRKARRLLQEVDKTPVQAVADYLRLLWQHAVANMKRNLGEAMVDGLAFEVVCTVPAVWSIAAVNKMRMAADDAGITAERLVGTTSLEFVSEPEAAALATFEDLKARPNIESGQTFVVCDAGGGTVDLISYKVAGTEPLQLDECVEGSGKLCGGVFLDEDFEKMIAQQLGDAWNVPDPIKNDFLDKEWEHGIKRAFRDQEKSWKVTLPYACVMPGASPYIMLPRYALPMNLHEIC